MMVFFEFILFIPLVLIFASHLTNVLYFGGWSKYRSCFNDLRNKDFEYDEMLPKKIWQRHGGQIRSEDGEFVWFSECNDFKIKNKYLHNSYLNYLDPHSLYWLKKYQKWAKDNINHIYLKDKN